MEDESKPVQKVNHQKLTNFSSILTKSGKTSKFDRQYVTRFAKSEKKWKLKKPVKKALILVYLKITKIQKMTKIDKNDQNCKKVCSTSILTIPTTHFSHFLDNFLDHFWWRDSRNMLIFGQNGVPQVLIRRSHLWGRTLPAVERINTPC